MTRRHPTADERDQMRELRHKGLSIPVIAARTKFSKSAVHRAVQGIGVDARITANRDRAAIPPPWLGKARRMLAGGMTRYAAAAALDIPTSTLYRALAKFSALIK